VTVKQVNAIIDQLLSSSVTLRPPRQGTAGEAYELEKGEQGYRLSVRQQQFASNGQLLELLRNGYFFRQRDIDQRLTMADTEVGGHGHDQSFMGRIVNRAIRPVPVCLIVRRSSSSSTRGGTELPVKTNIPRSPTSSTVDRTASQMEGTSCHSSTSRG